MPNEIKPEQVPDEAVDGLRKAMFRNGTAREYIAAALNAWPEARLIRNALSDSPKYIKLPVEGWTPEKTDDR